MSILGMPVGGAPLGQRRPASRRTVIIAVLVVLFLIAAGGALAWVSVSNQLANAKRDLVKKIERTGSELDNKVAGTNAKVDSVDNSKASEAGASFAGDVNVATDMSVGGLLSTNKLLVTGGTGESSLAPSSVLTVNGDSAFVGDTTTSGNQAVSGSQAVSGGVSVAGTTNLHGTVSTAHDLNVDGNLGVSGNQAVSGNQVVGGSTIIGGQATLQSGLNVSGQTNLSNTSVAGDLAVGGNLKVTGRSDLGALSAGSTNVSSFSASGQGRFNSIPTGSGVDQGSLYVNPPTAGPNDTLFGAAVGDSQKFRVDASGNIYGNNLILNGSTTTSGTTLATNLEVLDNTILGNASSDLLTVNASTTLNGSVAITGASPFTVGTGPTSLGGSLGVTGNTTLATLLTSGAANLDSLTVTNNAAVGGDLAVTGVISGDGSGLTALNGSNVSSGTVADARLSSNVALLDRNGQTFTGNGNYFTGGNVGIGTTSPTAKLDVAGTISQSSAGTMIWQNAIVGNDVYYDLRANGNMYFRSNLSTNRMTIDTAGNVGIGTTGPLARLDVNGVGAYGLGAVGAPSFAFRTDLDTGMWSSGANTLNLSTGGSERLKVDSSGNVGIGTSTPMSRLTVGGGTSSEALTVNAGGWADLRLTSGTSTGGNIYWNNGTTNAGGIFYYHGSGANYMSFTTNASERLRINSSGNVGIGTSSPLYKLDVSGGTGIVGQFSGRVIGGNAVNSNEFTTKSQLDALTSGTAGAFIQNGNSFGALAVLGTNDANSLALETNNVERLRIDTAGNVGIGTTTPSAKLDVQGGNINIAATSSTTGQITQAGNVLIHTAGGTSNFFGGTNAGNLTLTGVRSTGVGASALQNNTTGYNNTALGTQALQNNTTGYGNIATGTYGLSSNTTGYFNTATGLSVLTSNTSGYLNTGTGVSALNFNTTGFNNVAHGSYSLYNNTTGANNTANGNATLYVNTTGGQNVALGANSGRINTTGSNNTFIGYNAGYTGSTDGLSNATAIGYNTQVTASNSLILGNGANVGIGTTAPSSLLQLGSDAGTAASGIKFGSTGDTNLYRSAADTLKTDDALVVASNLTGNGPALFKNSADSTTAFQVQNAGGTAFFTLDSTNLKLTVTNLVVTANLTLNGHLITGGTAPTTAVNANAGTGATCTLAGTDTAGTITVVTGTGTVNAGTLCTVTFNSAYGSAPRVVLGAKGAAAAGLDPYSDNATTTTFVVGTATAGATSSTYKMEYIVAQ